MVPQVTCPTRKGALAVIQNNAKVRDLDQKLTLVGIDVIYIATYFGDAGPTMSGIAAEFN